MINTSLIQVAVDLQTPYSEKSQPPGWVSVSSPSMVMPLDDEATWQQWFQAWLTHLQVDLSPCGCYELGVRLTDNAEIQSLNATYRQQDQPTDVLAFAALEADLPYSDAMLAEIPIYLGDVVISVETAQDQALERGHSLTEELVWLATHGLLHLLGWDHPDETGLERMLKQQEDLLQTVGFKIQYDYPTNEC